MKIIFYILALLGNLWCITCFEPITLGSLVLWGGGISVGVLFSGIFLQNHEQIVKRACQIVGYCEGCEDKWITENMKGLEVDLRSNVFGQPIAIDTILMSLKHHFQNTKHPTKALVLSFHGPPGVGKNFVSQLILQNLFKMGRKTGFVHFFRGSVDFPNKKHINEYKDKISKIVRSKVEECNRSIFIFDEIDKIPSGVLDVLRPYLDYSAVYDGIEYRNTIFIFLSNLASLAITEKTLELWEQGYKREEYKLEHFQQVIRDSVFYDKGALHVSNLIKHYVINHYIPFLPLEKHHIRQCLDRDVAKMGQIMSDELYNQVLEMLTFGPDHLEIFAKNGCKLLSEKASMLIEREISKKRKYGRCGKSSKDKWRHPNFLIV